MVTKYYNIHDLISIRVVNHKKVFDRLAYFEADDIGEVGIDIILSNFTFPRSSGYELVDGKYWVGDHSIYCSYKHKLSFWKVWIEGLDQDKTIIHFWGDSWFSHELLFMLILEPLLAYKLSRKGVVVLHASSLSINERGYIFTGGTGIGKTTIVLKMMNDQSTEYYSDDQAYISGATLYSYPLPIGFRKHQVDRCAMKLSTLDYCILVLHNLINTITFYYPNLTRRVELKNIKFKNSPYSFHAGCQVPIDTIFVLSETIGAPIVQDLSADQAYKKILEYNEGNEDKLKVFHKYFSAYTKVYSGTDYWVDFKKELWKLVNSGINFYEILINKKYDFDDVLGRIMSIVESGMK